MNRRFMALVILGQMCAVGLWVSRGNASSQPCLVAKGDSPVAKACAEGGLFRAKQSMRAMVKQGRAAGARFDCEDCHTSTDHYEQLAPEAKQKFAKLLAALPR